MPFKFLRKLVLAVTTPSIYADLLLEYNGLRTRIDVEEPGWMEKYGGALNAAQRVGLALSGKTVCVWLTPNGTAPRYLSRVVGKIDETGHRQVRVAGLICGDVAVWLHRDGLVEVAPEPTYREC